MKSMQTKRINTMLWSLAALIACGAVAAIAMAIALPLETGALTNSSTRQPVPSATGPASPQLVAFEPIFQRPLRQALSDAPSSMPAEAGTPSGFQLTLAGTIGMLLRFCDVQTGRSK